MNAPRVSDECVKQIILICEMDVKDANEEVDLTEEVSMYDLAKDLKDARDQLKTHQEMRNLYNKEPE